MTEAWEKIFSLIKKTGDRCLVIDEKADQIYIVMDLAHYEKLIFSTSEIKNLSEEELLNKINRDISLWQSRQEEVPAVMPINEAIEGKEDKDEQLYLEPVD